jgi:hypothetical protein
MINGSNGSKILVCQKSSIILKNLETDTLTIRAVQFELENPKIGDQMDHADLMQIIISDSTEASQL